MAKDKAVNFVDLLGRSGLLEKPQIAAALDELARRHNGQPVTDNAIIADYMVETGLLTRWQADKILEGRYKAFFLSKYKLLDHLGTGGMSSVYLAEHVIMRRPVAIKVLPQKNVSDPAYLTRFYNEARAAGTLNHPNIVHTYDIDNSGDTHFIVMEYVPGKNLAELVKTEGPLGTRRAAEYIAQAADGLAHAHEAGLVHRDVKPANLLVDKNTIKLLDLGLAYFNIEGQTSLTMASEDNVLGTADYLAPEQAINSHNVDGRADIYSLGCTLYFLLTGHPPFDEGPIAQRLLMHQTQEPPSILKERPTAPRALVAICERMMEKKPDDRFQAAADVGSALRTWLAESSDAAGSSPRLTRFTDAPLRPSSETPGLKGRLVDRSGTADGSSIFGRELRPAGGSKESDKKRLDKPVVASSKTDVAEDLELAVLADEAPAGASKSGTKKPSSSSGTNRQPDASGSSNKPATTQSPQKPVDFTSWISEELARPDPLLQGADSGYGHRRQNDQGKFWLLLGIGIAVTLLASIVLVFVLI